MDRIVGKQLLLCRCFSVMKAQSSNSERQNGSVLFYSFDTLVFFGLFLGGPPPSSQINNTQRLILSYECPTLAWLVSCQLFLTYVNLTAFCLWGFIFLYFYTPFPTFFLSGLLCSWVAGPWCPPLLVLSLLLLAFGSPSIYSLCLPASLTLAPASLSAVQLFIRTIRCFRQAKNHSFTVNQMQHKQKPHTLK